MVYSFFSKLFFVAVFFVVVDDPVDGMCGCGQGGWWASGGSCGGLISCLHLVDGSRVPKGIRSGWNQAGRSAPTFYNLPRLWYSEL